MAIRLSSENKGSVNMELCKTALAARYAQEAKTASERAQAAAVHPPVIGGNGNWQIWDQGSGAYVDSGLRAAGPAGEQGPRGEAGNYTKPAAGIPEEDLSQDVRNKLNRGGASDYADLNNKPGINGVTLSGNKTTAQLGLAAADDVPTKTSQLQNDVGFLTQHQSLAAYRTSAAQDAIDANLMALGLTGASVGDLVRVNAVDANGKPTSWKHVPLCEIKTNPNLLDNWYFVGGGSQQGGGQFPINQRGQTNYSGNSYGIDRWKAGGVSTSLYADYIEFAYNGADQVHQYFENYDAFDGKRLTASILWGDGTLSSGSFVFSKNNTDWGSATFFSKGNFSLIFTASIGLDLYTTTAMTLTIKAIKLEVGDTQTLAHQENGVWVLNEIPDYWQELAKCQRYYIEFNKNVFSGFSNSAGSYAYVSTGIIMASEPTISVQNTGTIIAKDGENQISNIIIWSASKPSVGLQIAFATANSSHADSLACLADSVFTLSCDL